MKMFVLRAFIEETYDCPDSGEIKICDRYEDVSFSRDLTRLKDIANDLNAGFQGGYWNEERHKHLRTIHAGYDLGYIYTVWDISDLIIEETK